MIGEEDYFEIMKVIIATRMVVNNLKVYDLKN